MKLLLTALALLVGLQAQATSIQVSTDKVLPTVTVDKQLTSLVGVVEIHFVEDKITLSLYQDPCRHYTKRPHEMTCMAMPSLKNQYEVPLEKVKRDACGSVTYSGKVDRRPIDGPLTAIQVIDNTYNACEMVLPFLTRASVYQEFVSRMSSKTIKKKIEAVAK